MSKTALVSGNKGFLGRHFQSELEHRGWRVDGFDLDAADALDVYRNLETVYDLIVPAAYWVGGRGAIDGVNTNLARNLVLDGALFEAAVRTGQKRVLYFSSSAVYPVHLQGNNYGYHQHRLDEHRQPQGGFGGRPDANYGWAKVTGERLAEDARRSGLAVSVVRPFSGYGEDQSLDYPFPSIVKRAREGDLTVWGPEGQTRDWIHVDDVVNGALAVVDSGTELPVNLCTGVGTEMGDLAQLVARKAKEARVYAGHEGALVRYLEDKPTGVFYRVGDPTRMLQYYTPKISIDEGIRRALQA